MGMPITVEVIDETADQTLLDRIFAYFHHIDQTFSTYKPDSEISRINRGELSEPEWSEEMKTVFALAAQTKKETHGYFEIKTPAGPYDPSGLVKGWAIQHAAQILSAAGYQNFFVEAGGDIQVRGHNAAGQPWAIGIKNPFRQTEIVKTIYLQTEGVATSGTYLRGQHVYNPLKPSEPLIEVVSLTVIGPNVYEADRFATAAFAMGQAGIAFIENWPGLEAYQIDPQGQALMTSGFERYTIKHHD